MEAGVARVGLAMTSYFSGDFAEARTHCERALEACSPERDREARERSGEDTGTAAMSCLAATKWQVGEIERARELIDDAMRRATEIGHVPSMAGTLYRKSYLEILRGDAGAALSAAEALENLSREHGMSHFRVLAELESGWARGRLIDPVAGAAELRRALAAFADRGARVGAGFYYGLLAQLEAETLGAEGALARIDEALAFAHQVDYRCDLVFLHRLRGEILLKVDPGNPAPAEEAFQTAVVIAQQQGARSHGLRAALVARQALSIDRPPGRSPRRPRARARRFRADARNARDRRGAGAVGGYRGRRACEARINTAMGWLSCYSE